MSSHRLNIADDYCSRGHRQIPRNVVESKSGPRCRICRHSEENVPRGKKRPRTALLTAAIWRRDDYKQCRTCKAMKHPEEFEKWRAVCRSCDSRQKSDRQRKVAPQEVVRVPVKGWGCR
jgi:hypothetical protein